MTGETEVEASVTKFANSELFRRAVELGQKERSSQMYWAGLSVDKRAVLMVLVKETLHKLLEEPEGWVPLALEPSGTDWINLNIRVQMPHLPDDEIASQMEKIREKNDAIAELIQIERGLRP